MIPKATLIQMQRDGKSYSEIGRIFNLHVPGVQYYIIKYGIQSSYSKKVERNKRIRALCFRMRKAGIVLRKIVEKTGILRTTLMYWLRNAGIYRKSGWKLSRVTRERMRQARLGICGPDHQGWIPKPLISCASCGKKFYRRNPRKGRGGRFCSVPCSHTYQVGPCHPCWKDSKTPRGGGTRTHWATLVIRRNKMCKRCGTKKDLQGHHIHPWARFPKLRLSLLNGVALCARCHRLVHRTKDKRWVV